MEASGLEPVMWTEKIYMLFKKLLILLSEVLFLVVIGTALNVYGGLNTVWFVPFNEVVGLVWDTIS